MIVRRIKRLSGERMKTKNNKLRTKLTLLTVALLACELTKQTEWSDKIARGS